MDFYLVRHGEAVPDAMDSQRPLSRHGAAQVEQVARVAVARKARISTIFHSGIQRAQQSAEILSRYLLPASGVHRMTGLLPQDDPAVARAELETVHEPVMLVGHLPHLSRLVALLINGDADRETVEFAPGTVACLAHEKTGWRLSWVLNPDFF